MTPIKEKIINQVTYYVSIAFYILARQAHQDLLRYEKYLESVFGKNSELLNMLYDPSMKGNKAEFEEFLSKNAISVDWQGTLMPQSEVHKSVRR